MEPYQSGGAARMSDKLDLALRFACLGWKLFPQDRNKRPLIKDWPNRATSDPGQITGFFLLNWDIGIEEERNEQ